jgi:4-hydroxy-2-oxoheptanedioate aldolase
MQLPANRFKRRLLESSRQIGFWLTLSGTYSTEAVAGAGFDWLLVDMEHSPAELENVLSQLQTVAAYDTAAIVRPPQNERVIIKRLLDIGAQSLLIPYVQSPSEAEAAVEAIRYPPNGIRGVSATTRATRFGRVPNYGQTADSELCVIVQVETGAALEDLEAIATVDGVDAVFFGPGDLAASMGYIGEPGHPAVKSAVLDGVRRTTVLGRPCGLLTADQAFAAECLEAGASFVAIGVDANVLARGVDAALAKFRAA